MKRWISPLVLAAIASLASLPVRAADPCCQSKIRVLLTVGGHGYEEEPFYAVFKAMPDVTFTIAQMPKDAGLLKPGLEKDYDVIVMYDMCGAITPEQQKAFAALLNQGIGLVSLHHNMGAHQGWDEFGKIIGGKFFLKACEYAGEKQKQSGWDHDQDMKITVADREHPITKGMKDFQIHDEVYNHYWTDPKAKVLLKTDHPKNDPEIAWVTQYGKSRVFYLMLGHDSKAYVNPSYRQLVHRGICWAAGK